MSALPNTSTTEARRFGSGQAVVRLEDDQLLTGRGRYTDDLSQPGQLHVAFLRSPYPHARIVSIDTSAAVGMPGVARVYTGADLAGAGLKPLPGVAGFRRPDGQAASGPDRRALAHERVRFVGEPVVAVLADTLQQAKDAAEAVYVEFEELPMVVETHAAVADGAPVLSEQEAPGNICAEMRHGDPKAAEAAFAKAKHVVRLHINNQRLAAVTLEPRAVMAAPESADSSRTVLRMSTQMPTGVRDTLAGMLGIANTELRVLVSDVGGGFGMKTGLYPEDAVVGFAARELKRPVKWIADRGEEFLATTHGRDVDVQAEMALADDGRILALRLHSLANVGAYPTGAGVAIQLLIGPWVQTSVYDIPLIDFRFQAVLTNTAPTGAYRGAGRPEAIFNMERLMDEAARQTGIDRITLRRRNFVRPEQMPYTNPMAQVYDSGRFERVMDKGLELADWNGFDARAAQSTKNGKVRGLGIATFLEWTGGNALQESVTVSVLAEENIVEVFSAVNAMGQGIATSLSQLVVDAFGVPIEQVRVVLGDTDRGNGFGSAGSRSLFTGGSALHEGAEKTIAHARGLAAKELEAAADDIDYEAGRFSVKGTDLSIGLFDLAGKQNGQRIVVDSSTTVGGPSWPNGCHVCEVELDPATGEVDVVAYSSVNDVGNVVNPMIVRGQLDGGAVQGLGQALMEQIAYDPDSGQLITGSLMDYALPIAIQAPPFRTEMDTGTPCLTNPLGVKGVGELGTIGATPSVVNAVADALTRAGHKDKAPQLQMPLTPNRLWQLISG